MANTFVRSKLVLNITDIDDDWLWSDTWKLHKEGVPVYSIHFVATGAADKCILRDGSITGPVVFHRIAVAVGDQVPSYFGGNIIQLALDFSEGVYTADSIIVITLDRPRM